MHIAGNTNGAWPRTLVKLQMECYDVYAALKDSKHKKLVDKYLSLPSF